jgi:hypothetical protein
MVPSTPASNLGYDLFVTGPQRRPRSSASTTDAPDTPPGPPEERSRPIRAMQSVEQRVATQAKPPASRQKEQEEQPNDVPFRDRDVRRSREFHASAAPTRLIPSRRERSAALLPHQRVRQLPRDRSDSRRRDLPGLRLYAADALTRIRITRSARLDARVIASQHPCIDR